MREDDVAVVFCADLAEKEALLASEPDVLFTTPHDDGHPSVLVRLHAIDEAELTELSRTPGGRGPRPGCEPPSTTTTPPADRRPSLPPARDVGHAVAVRAVHRAPGG
jgi:hypothetical protein